MPQMLNPVDTPPQEHDFYAALAINRFDLANVEGYHITLYYRTPDDNTVRSLNLRWHHKIARMKPTPGELWCEFNLPEERTQMIALACARIWKKHKKLKRVPYGFSLPDGFFDPETSEILSGEGRIGLTCATFILAVLDAAELHPIDYDLWEDRPEDLQWQTFVVSQLEKLLEKDEITQQHFELVSADIGAFRIKPSEIIASSTNPLVRNSMHTLAPIGKRIETEATAWVGASV